MNWLDELNEWQRNNIDRNGNYMGKLVPGFPYKPGEYVPVYVRYSAMNSHRWACKAELMNKKQKRA